MAAVTGANVETFSKLLKELYLPSVIEQLNQPILLDMILTQRVYAKVSWQRESGGVIWTPNVYGPWESPLNYATDNLLWGQFTTTIEVPVMDANIEQIIRDYFLPVLSQHTIELRSIPFRIDAQRTVIDEGYKMMCMRCGHVTKFQVPPLTTLRERTRESVEVYLRSIVDTHFRPWEKVQCATEGTLRTLVAEWLTTRLVDHGALFDHQLGPMLAADGYEHWDPEFVLLIAEGLDFVDDLTEHHQGKMLLLPTEHPLAPC